MKLRLIFIALTSFLFISYLGIANPVVQNETSSNKTEQTQRKKMNPIERFVHKRFQKKLKRKTAKTNKKASKKSVIALVLVILAFPVGLLFGILAMELKIVFAGWGLFSLVALFIGSEARKTAKNKKTKVVAMFAIVLAIISFGIALLVASIVPSGPPW